MLGNYLRASSVPVISGEPIAYVGGYAQTLIGTTSDVVVTFGGNLTGGVSNSASEGDLVIVYFGTGSVVEQAISISGYTQLTKLYVDASLYDTNLLVAYKFMGSTPDTSITLLGGTFDTRDAGAVCIQVWRNVNLTTPFDVTTTTDTNSSTVLCDPPSITPVTSGSYIVSGGAGAHSRGIPVFTSSDLSGFISVGSNDTRDVAIGLGYKEWVSGSFDPSQFTFGGLDSTSNSNASVTIALRPA